MIKILLEAPIMTLSGYGETSRFVYKALRQRKLESNKAMSIDVLPVNWGNTSHLPDSVDILMKEDIERCQKHIKKVSEEKKENLNIEDLGYNLHIHVGIPNEFNKKAEYCVCVTAGIETDRVDASWLLKTHQGINKIITPSEHSANGFKKTSYEITNNNNNTKTILNCGSKVDIIPYPIKKIEGQPLDINFETDFNFLTIAMSGPRKDLENTIRCFVEEFREDDDVGLVIKTSQSRSSIMDRRSTLKYYKEIAKSLGDKKCKVYLLHGNLSESEINSLYTHPKIKAYFTTTHGEGYGLPIFEAAYNGLPVAATNWSGHLDFLTGKVKKGKKSKKLKNKELFAKIDFTMTQVPPTVVWQDIIREDSKWATVKPQSAKQQIRNIFSKYSTYLEWANILKEQILIKYDYNKVMNEMVTAIFEDFQSNIKEAESGMDITKL